MSRPLISARPRVQHALRSNRGRMLDPGWAGAGFAPTAYNAEGLIVAAAPDSASGIGAALRDVLRRRDCELDGPAWLGSGGGVFGSEPSFVSGVRIRPLGQHAPDPWTLLTELRQEVDPELGRAVGLNHLLTTPELVGGNPFAIGHGRVGLDAAGQAADGRGAVTLLGGPPRPRQLARRPRVVLLDTEVGPHRWFAGDPPVSSISMSDGSVVGDEIHPYPRATKRTPAGVVQSLLGTLASRAGHGTFIAGLVRQACPEAAIVALPVMGTDGVVPEHMLIRALDLVLMKQRQSPGWADAIILSLGYYAESAADLEYTSGLQRILLQLGRAGVAVFASAGNDCTSRPSFPAALAIDPAFAAPEVMPVVSVAALNADLSIAPFSNDGPWVTAEAIGVNVVSTAAPLDGGTISAQEATDRWGRLHASPDADSFSSGFATWSGTSFATPVVAGEYLSNLIDAGFPESIPERRALLPLRPQRVRGS